MHRIDRTILLLIAAAGLTAADAPPLTGMWGAGDALLALDAQGGRLQSGCLLANLSPVRRDANGAFSAAAQVQSLSASLPEEDAADPSPLPGKVTGRLASGGIDVTLEVDGQPPRMLHLLTGQRGTQARCL